MRYCTFLLILLPFITFGQIKEKRYRAGVKAGTEIGILIVKSSDNQTSHTGVGIGYAVMVDFIEYKLNDVWSASLGLGYANKQFVQHTNNNIKVIDRPATVDETINLSNIEVPLTLNYTFKKKSKHSYTILLGGAFNYQLGHNSKADLQLSDGSGIERPIDFSIPQTSYSAITSVTIETFTKKSFSWIIEPSIKYNFMSLNPEYGNSISALLSMCLTIGIKF